MTEDIMRIWYKEMPSLKQCQGLLWRKGGVYWDCATPFPRLGIQVCSGGGFGQCIHLMLFEEVPGLTTAKGHSCPGRKCRPSLQP